MRKLFSAGVPCKANCQYCFAKWNNMYSKLPILERTTLIGNKAIIYPCCDGDLSNQNELIKTVKNVSKDMCKVYVSISTKCFINDDVITNLDQLNRELLSENKGFVKLAISLSNVSLIDKIEPDTMTYAGRLSLAKQINETTIPLTVTIKPVLPFVPTKEYYQIIDDFSKYTKYFLIGGLYLNRESKFYSDYITNKDLIQKRAVGWLPERPEWEYLENNEQFKKIRKYAENKAIRLFDSDVDLIMSYINQEG